MEADILIPAISNRKLNYTTIAITGFVLGLSLLSVVVDSAFLFGILTIGLGIPILIIDAQANQPFISIGALFWSGHVLTRVLAPWTRAWLSLSPISSFVFQITFIGMSAFTIAYVLVLGFTRPTVRRWLNPNDIKLNWILVLLVSGVITFVATIGYSLAGNTSRGVIPIFTPMLNVLGGILETVIMLPAVFLALSIIKRSWQFAAILAVLWASIFMGSVLQSSRGLLLRSVFIVLFVWSYFQPTSKKIIKTSVLIFFGSVYMMMLLGFYRGRYSGELSISSRISQLAETFRETVFSSDYLQPQALRVAQRLYAEESIDLIHYAERYNIRDPWYALDQLVYFYVPKFLYPEKGAGLQQDLLYKYGLVPVRHEASNVTVILLADAYFRWGILGVIIIYASLGCFLALLAKLFWGRKNLFLVCVVMSVIGFDSFYSFESDIYNLLTWWMFEIPKFLILSMAVTIALGSRQEMKSQIL